MRKLIIPILILALIAVLITPAIGCVGEQGSKGDQGSMGIQGEQGEQGGQGVQGRQGPTGKQGETGLQGVVGKAGAKGATGSTGAAGAQGTQGEVGPAGPRGSSGSKGATGATGPAGPTPMFQVSLGAEGGGSALLNSTTVQSDSFSIELDSGSGSAGDEGRIVLIPLKPISLNQITSIVWAIYANIGYPAHVDITFDCDQDGVVDPEDMLTAEMAYNCVGTPWDIVPLCSSMTYPTGWLQTFELTSGDGFGAVTDSTMLWVTKMGAGDDDAPWDTLANWKTGLMTNNPGGDSLTAGVINGSVIITKIEIEVDNWMVNSIAYIDDIYINGQLVWAD